MGAYAIYGTGGFAREVLGPLKQMLAADAISAGGGCKAGGADMIAFIDDEPAAQGKKVQGVDVIGYDQARAENYAISIAIADSSIRKAKARQMAEDGVAALSITALTGSRYDNITIGAGAIICDYVTLTTDAVIGAHFQANIYSYVAHDCSIGDYVTFAPRVCCNGNVTIGDGAYIGTSAVLRQGVTIGDGAVVGMGAIVTKDVAAGVTVIGNPARVLQR